MNNELIEAESLLKSQGETIPEAHLTHISPVAWEHISLTGDYIWNLDAPVSGTDLGELRRAA